ncbi:MAG: lytic murein transglycosylase [Burkholderiaceae bacterium]
MPVETFVPAATAATVATSVQITSPVRVAAPARRRGVSLLPAGLFPASRFSASRFSASLLLAGLLGVLPATLSAQPGKQAIGSPPATSAAGQSAPAKARSTPIQAQGASTKTQRASAKAQAGVTAADPADFPACLARLRPQAAEQGLPGPAFDRLTAALAPDLAVLGFLDAQPEFVTPLWDYLAGLVDDERVADGRRQLARWASTLQQVEAAYRVDPATVVAVWGVESDFGNRFGSRALLESLSALACYGRRQTYFRGEFISALRIVEEGHVAPEKLLGSWAGAFGHTQFMPSTFMRLAVDFDGDGRRDLVDSVPDALASTANFLQKAGWRDTLPWGFEVALPASFDATTAGRRNKQPASAWAARGIRRIDGAPLIGTGTGTDTDTGTATATATAVGIAADIPTAILLPAGRDGPAFLVTRNFDALYAYNAAESYALAIAHLSDRLRGGGAFATPWPTDDPGLSRAERRELQRRLAERGHEIGAIDGMIGSRTREALRAELVKLGLPPDSRAGQKALAALRAADQPHRGQSRPAPHERP